MFSKLSESLRPLVELKYQAAKAASSVIYSPSQLAVIRTPPGIPIQVRYCPTLSKKPAAAPKATSEKKANPFEIPTGDLYIGEIGQPDVSHVLVLNKFPIIANHFILATKQFKQQKDGLEADDLAATFACLKEWEKGSSGDSPERLFAFFNCGDNSGASQPHRHVQFLPVEDMREGDTTHEWEPLIDLLEKNNDQSRVHFGYSLKRLPEDPAASDLHAIYSDLRQRSYEAWAEDCSEIQATPKTPEKFSFNMAMTVSAMVICPRTRDGCTLGSVGDVTLNGTMLAGTFMVKEEKLWEFIKREPQVPMNAMRTVGILPPLDGRSSF